MELTKKQPTMSKCRNTYTDECIGDGFGEMQYDAYGYATGRFCHECYENGKYPYRKDAYYDYLNAGEYLY